MLKNLKKILKNQRLFGLEFILTKILIKKDQTLLAQYRSLMKN